MYSNLEQNLSIIHLRVTLGARDQVNFGPHTGTAMRAALLNALRGPKDDLTSGFCTQRQLKVCNGCPALKQCAIAPVVGFNHPDAVRPYALRVSQPGKTQYNPGETWSVGVSLFAPNLYDYFLQAMGKLSFCNGRVDLTGLETVNLATGNKSTSLDAPLCTTPDDVARRAERIYQTIKRQHGGIQIRFLSPVGLKDRSCGVAREPHLDVLCHRIQSRLYLLQNIQPGEKMVGAGKTALLSNQCRWVDVRSPSSRTESASQIGGLIGSATYSIEKSPTTQKNVATLLAWGEAMQVGWGTAKGDGVVFANAGDF